MGKYTICLIIKKKFNINIIIFILSILIRNEYFTPLICSILGKLGLLVPLKALGTPSHYSERFYPFTPNTGKGI